MTTPAGVDLPRPLRVAVVGAGPAGFYTVEALLKHDEIAVDVDLFERLPAPYGLLRYGVAPDHPRIKGVSAAYDRVVERPQVRFLGNVMVGAAGQLQVEDLLACYDQVVFATGCETDRRLGIPGEDLAGSHAATAFVGWYNGHPDFADLPVDLSCERAVVVGIGDVAMDLARILLQDAGALAGTDIAAHALDKLHESRIREVVILARRGPGQAAFAAKELEDIAELPGVSVSVDAALVAEAQASCDPHSATDKHKLDVLAGLAAGAGGGAGADEAANPGTGGGGRHLDIRFLASPVEIAGDNGRVTSLVVEHNRLVRHDDGRVTAQGTGRRETIETGLVLRSVGYLGVPIAGLPFDPERGIVPNAEGRVLGPGGVLPRLYVTGWIKRGATGVVGTNKGDAAATVTRLLEDLATLPLKDAAEVSRDAVDARLRGLGTPVVGWEDWKRIDAAERERGKPAGKVREKFIRIPDLLAAAKP